jgi:hypothetical protein
MQSYWEIVNFLKVALGLKKSSPAAPSSTLVAKDAKVTDSPVASGTNISQTINSPTTINVSLPHGPVLSETLTESWLDLYREKKRLEAEVEALKARADLDNVSIDSPLIVRRMTRLEMRKAEQIAQMEKDIALINEKLKQGARRDQNPRRPAWPDEKGEYIAVSSEAIPYFPDKLSEFRPAGDDKDFWSKPFPPRGSIRLLEGNDWEGIPNFPHTMNGCSHGVFMIRWRSADPSLPVRSSLRHSSKSKGDEKTGAFGYMSGTNCEQPMFKIVETPHGHTLVDLFYELKFWQAAPSKLTNNSQQGGQNKESVR